MGTSKLITAALVVWVAMLSLAAMTTAAQQAPATPGAGEYRPPPAPEQPLPYSHKAHLAQGLKCVMCHESVETDDHATLPPTATCMGCHANVKTDSPHIQKLAAAAREKKPMPWVRVYQLPDYVYFSHRVHTAAGTTCETCHGPVRERDVITKEVAHNMKSCIACHDATKARNDCKTCHEEKG